MSGRVSVRRVYVWSGKYPSGIYPRVSVGRVYVQSGKCPVTGETSRIIGERFDEHEDDIQKKKSDTQYVRNMHCSVF